MPLRACARRARAGLPVLRQRPSSPPPRRRSAPRSTGIAADHAAQRRPRRGAAGGAAVRASEEATSDMPPHGRRRPSFCRGSRGRATAARRAPLDRRAAGAQALPGSGEAADLKAAQTPRSAYWDRRFSESPRPSAARSRRCATRLSLRRVQGLCLSLGDGLGGLGDVAECWPVSAWCLLGDGLCRRRPARPPVDLCRGLTAGELSHLARARPRSPGCSTRPRRGRRAPGARTAPRSSTPGRCSRR